MSFIWFLQNVSALSTIYQIKKLYPALLYQFLRYIIHLSALFYSAIFYSALLHTPLRITSPSGSAAHHPPLLQSSTNTSSLTTWRVVARRSCHGDRMSRDSVRYSEMQHLFPVDTVVVMVTGLTAAAQFVFLWFTVLNLQLWCFSLTCQMEPLTVPSPAMSPIILKFCPHLGTFKCLAFVPWFIVSPDWVLDRL